MKRASVVRRDVRHALATEQRRYDLILCDPPYGFEEDAKIASHLARALAVDGVLVFETTARREPTLEGLRVRTSRTYGSARLTLFEHES